MSSVSDSRPQGKGPKVSIVITTFNRGAIVPVAINSALRQTYSDHELIVVDDGSTDDTRDRLQKYGPRIQYVYQTNCGVSAARNAGIHLAKGEWIAFLDSDDVWHPAKLERQFEALASLGQGFGACVTNCNFAGELSLSSTTLFDETKLKTDSAFGPLCNARRYIEPNAYAICVQSLLVMTSLLNEVGSFDEALGIGEDRDLIFRLSYKTKLCYVSAPLVRIDRTPGRSRLTDLCSTRADVVCKWGELLRRKMLAHPEFIDVSERQIVQRELVDLCYDCAAMHAADLDLTGVLKSAKKIRKMGPGYWTIFCHLLARMGKKVLRNVRPRVSES